MKFNVIRVSVKNEAFNVTGKKTFFVFDDSVCFLLSRVLSIDFVNNYQLIKYSFETVSLPNFLSF